jgi:YesN/AraC family two-component response regulator
MPDLIVSDLMMPILNGNEMTAQLKTDERTSHIPVILLTAKASRESRLEGLETGADDFLTKPFDADELQIRIKNLIDQRSKLREILSQHIGEPSQTRLIRESSGKMMTKVDEQFIEKATALILEHMSDPELNVELFAAEMAMSRMQLHRKLTSLAGTSASDLIRDLRLKKAAELLKAGELNVTEISYEIGVSSLSNFSKIFKKKYGETPSEYAQSQQRI